MGNGSGAATRFSGDATDVMDWLRANGVERLRVEWADFGGVARGKAIAIDQVEHILEHGVAFCASALAFDVLANVVPGTDFAETIGYGDFIGKPDLSSLRLLRHEGGTAQVIADLVWPDGSPVESDPRYVLRRVAKDLKALGYDAFAAPEFEFFLLDDEHRLLDEGVQCYSMQKRTEFLSEEYALLDAAAAHCQIEGSHYEYGPGQYEITMRYQEVCAMADCGHLFRATMKEAAMAMGRRITFMAKPFDGKTGNSCHLHLSLTNADGSNAFAAPDQPLHISDTCRHFIGGVLAHMSELTAVFFPNSNSYRRLVPANFAPTSLAWAVDNRTAAVRVINETPAGTRAELRVCGGDINVFLALAAYLAAGIDGIRNETDPGAPSEGDLDVQDIARLPDDWGEALAAFDGSDWVKGALGEAFCRNYGTVKRFEYETFRRTVTDNERARYIEWL